MRRPRSAAVHYLAATAMVAVVLLLRVPLRSIIGDQAPFILMPLAVLGAAWYAGLGPALWATLLGGAACDLLFVDPTYSFSFGTHGAMLVVVFLIESVLIALFGASRKSALAEVLRRERLLNVTLTSIGDAVIATDLEGRVTFMNPVAERLTGWPKEEAGSRPLVEIFRILNEETGEPAENPVARVLVEGIAVGLANHTVLLTRDGRSIPIEDSAAPILDADDRMLGVILVFHDVAGQRRNEIEQEFQIRATERLFSSLDYQTTLAEVARFAVPEIADWCAVDMLDDDGVVRRVAVAHVDPEKVKWAVELEKRYPVDMSAPTGLPQVLRTGRPEFYPAITEEMIVAAAKNEEELALLREISFSALMIVPLFAQEKVIGAIQFVMTESGRRYDERNLRMAEDLARRASTAIDNALLHRDIAEQREWFRVTLASIGDAVIVTDTAGLVTFLNPVAQSLTGYSQQEAMGRPLREIFPIIHEDSREEVESPVERVLREGRIVGLANHAVLVARDGGHIPIEDSAAPIIGERGDLRGVVMVFHDVAEQREADYALRESELRFRMLADSAPVLIWMADENGACIYLNKPWLDFTGRTMEEELGTGWADMVHPDDLERARSIFRDAVAARGELMMEFRLRRHDGEYRWLFETGIPRFTPGGSFIGYIGSCIDITDRKLAEIGLRQAKEEAEAASRAKDQFMAVLSHELRTPLTPVLAMVHAMEGDNRFPRDMQGYFEIIRRNVELEARLIDDLLDLTRITKGKLQLSFEDVDASLLMRNVLEIVRSDVQAKKITLRTEFRAQYRTVRADSARLQQVFWNLLKNAVKFTPVGGIITVSSINTPDGHLQMRVTDSGIGIEPEIMPRIFDAFEQGEQTITRHFGGLGLGLSISKALMVAHGGTLSAESDGRDQGATFIVDMMPRPEKTRSSFPERDGAPEPEVEDRPYRILIVEDHPDTVTVTRMLLERAGYKVFSAGSVGEALEIAATTELDLIVSDIGLPDGSGLDLMRKIAGQGDIRGIAVSGFGMEEDIARSKEAGFSEHITKPMNFPALQEAIRRVLGHHEA